MGADYYFYLEVKINDRWVLTNKKVRARARDNVKGSVVIPSYWCGSRTYFGEAWDKLRDIGGAINVGGISKDLRIYLQKVYMNDFRSVEIISVPFSEIKKELGDKKYDRVGFVKKSDLLSEEEIFEWLQVEEYEELDSEVKKAYEYHEWVDPYGWLRFFKMLVEHLEPDIDEFNFHYNRDMTGSRLIGVMDY